MLPSMNNKVKYALREAAGIAGDVARAYTIPLALPVVVPVVAALSATALAGWLADTAGRAILSELRRRARLRAPRPPSPSLRGTPTPEEFAADAAERPRTLSVRLRIGSRLADLAPTLDRGNLYDISPTGARRIRGRGRGVRGWLADNRVAMNYSTLMRYMRLAVRLRALLSLDERIPLEWLLPGAAPSAEVPPALRMHCASAKRRLARLMRAHWNFSRLQGHVDEALGLRRLPRPDRPNGKPLDAILAENVRRELADFLHARDLSPEQEALRQAALAGFPAPRPGPGARDAPMETCPAGTGCGIQDGNASAGNGIRAGAMEGTRFA